MSNKACCINILCSGLDTCLLFGGYNPILGLQSSSGPLRLLLACLDDWPLVFLILSMLEGSCNPFYFVYYLGNCKYDNFKSMVSLEGKF